MSTHVTIDDSLPTCIGVHYRASLDAAKAHFEQAGFRGISGMTIMQSSLNCNEARRRALDAAKRGEGKVFYQGNWDYSAGRCALYRFDFTSYDGPRFRSPKNGAAEYHVDWVEVMAERRPDSDHPST